MRAHMVVGVNTGQELFFRWTLDEKVIRIKLEKKEWRGLKRENYPREKCDVKI